MSGHAVSRTTPCDELPELLRVEEAAAWLGTSRGLIYELVRQGELTGVRLGRLLRIPRTSLIAKAQAVTP